MTAIFESPVETLGDHIARLHAVEAVAETVQIWQPLFIPGLLQSYAYAVGAIRATSPALPLEVVGERAEARRHRLDQLGHSGTRSVVAIVDESALHRPVGGYAALVDQLEHLLAAEALQPSVTVRVLPQGIEAHPGLSGPFTIYRAAGKRAVFVEALTESSISTRPEDVAAYGGAWDRLLGLALPPRESMELIHGVKETLCRRLTAR
ncbi:DUF5753 domain-containing protein [Streptomyces sp. NPDC001634]|uniref:DUF5753 domain-containing protein n=1 Tax=Streptomyces sp. NPDC001634 TaxID=3154390 RepID=UPI00332BDDFA